MPIDYKEYPENWKTEIRPAVLKRADNKCEFCGVENHRLIERYGKGQDDWHYCPKGIDKDLLEAEGRKITKIVLTIAHLDHDKENQNVDLERLRALCQKCHLGYDLERHKKNRKYGRNHEENQTNLFQ